MPFIYTTPGLGALPFRFKKKTTTAKVGSFFNKAVLQPKKEKAPLAPALKNVLVKKIAAVSSRIKSRANASILPSAFTPGQMFIKSQAVERQKKLARSRAVWPFRDVQPGQYEQVPAGVYRPWQTFGPNGQPVPVFVQPPAISSRPPETVTEGDTVGGEPVQSAGVVTTAQSSTTPIITQERPFIEVTDISPEAQAGVIGGEENPLLKYGVLAVGAYILYDSFKSSKRKTKRRAATWTGY